MAEDKKPNTVEEKKPDPSQSSYKHIVRIANIDVPGGKPIGTALTKIKGVGKNLAAVFCNMTKIDRNSKTGNMEAADIAKLTDIINNPQKFNLPAWLFNRRKDHDTGEDKHIITGTLDFTKDNDIKRLRKIKCYKGNRHSRRLPVRGQRTKSNFRRSKGKVVGVKRKGGAKKGK